MNKDEDTDATSAAEDEDVEGEDENEGDQDEGSEVEDNAEDVSKYNPLSNPFFERSYYSFRRICAQTRCRKW